MPDLLEERVSTAKETNATSLNLSSLGLRKLPQEVTQLTQLQHLDLSINQISELPPDIVELTQLQTLRLWVNRIEGLQPEVVHFLKDLQGIYVDSPVLMRMVQYGQWKELGVHGHFPGIFETITDWSQLNKLQLVSCKLSELPPEVAQLTQLQHLDLMNNQLSELPPEVAQLTQLRHLFLSSNQLSELPPEVAQLTQLQHLFLSSNQLSELPPEVAQLTQLQHLDLSSNQLSELPPEVAQLTQLQHLDLRYNQLSELPPEVAQLTQLQHLDLSYNQLSELPPEVAQLTQLQHLDLSSNQLSELPPEVAQLTQLQHLDLRYNQLSELPPEVAQLTQLQHLDLSYNQLSELPPEVAQLTQLQHLDLSSNQLSELPPEVAQLTQLQHLDLSSNQLSELPPEVAQLTQLQHLSLSSNQLSELPPEVAQLTQLQHLDLRYNQLSELPPEVAQLRKIQSLSIQNNSPRLDLLQRLFQQSSERFRAFLSSLEEAPRLYEGKVLFVGEGKVGKSTLLAALNSQPFKQNRDSTHGIEVQRLVLPHPEIAETQLELRAWDFGGQPFYRISHQFFYSAQAVYLLLWEPRRGPEGCEVEEWIERIRLRVGTTARIFIVATHCKIGDRVARIDKNVLRRDYGEMILGFHEVDSADGSGISDLRDAIATATACLPHMGDRFSPRWRTVRDHLQALDSHHVRYSEIVKLAHDQEGMTETETETLLSLLHDVGDVICFLDHDDLREEVILDPEWVSKAISLVLEDPSTNGDYGVLEHRQLAKIWTEHAKRDHPTFPRELHPFLLRLMEKYDVCYRLEGGEQSLVSQLVPDIRPDDLPWTADCPSAVDGQGKVSLVCSMREVPPGLVPWLIVRTHRYASQPRRHWQQGSFLSYREHGEALLELRGRSLYVTVQADWPQHFMTILQDILQNLINSRWPGLDPGFGVPCPNCASGLRLEALRKIKKRSPTTDCSACGEEWNIDLLLTGFQPVHDLTLEVRKLQNTVDAGFSKAARHHTALLRAFGAENDVGPRMFTLLPEYPDGWSLSHIGKITQRLTLWCEHPDEPHPTCPIGSGAKDSLQGERGEYLFESSKEWLLKVAPLANRVALALKVLVPVGGAALKVALDESVLKDAKPKLALMEKLTSNLLKPVEVSESQDETSEFITQAEGAALREFHQMLLTLDSKRTWGQLRRVLTETGEYRWLCPKHYREFEPELPKLS